MSEKPSTQRVQIEITWKSVMRLLAGVLLGYIATLLWPFFKLVILAVLIAVAFHPLVRWVQRHGQRRWVGVLAASLALLVVVAGCFATIGPLALRQAAGLRQNLPRIREQILAQLPAKGPIRQALENELNPGAVANSREMLGRMVQVAATTAGGLFDLVVVLVLAIYLLADGPNAWQWLVVFFPADQRAKIEQASGEVASLVFAYVAGQFVVSALCATYLFIVLTVLGVPMALLLGIIAGICDVVPILGFCVAVGLAMLLGLTVSPTKALLIFVLYGAYHLFENFYVFPKVYGKQLRISKLAVPLAVAVGGLLAGVVGAVVALPLVAAYPVVERLWLKTTLPPDTLKVHGKKQG